MKNLILTRLIIIYGLISFNAMFSLAQEPVIQTEQGKVSGYKNGEIRIFKGIPFAAPPVGELRWKAPLPPEKRSEVLICDKFSASPMQNYPKPFMMWTEEFITPPDKLSEDCLYLNIWTPTKSPKDKLPVFVWIYGGGFSSGSSACAVYDGEEMSKEGIVFVSLNYRVGVFGFLAHPELSNESENKVSGNYGLLDQVAALKWIQRNIEAFGGDPEKVTIAGQSAGSMSVCALVSSPLARGLFRGAIAQSGGILTRFMNRDLADAEKAGVALMGKMKVTNISELRKIPADELIGAGGNFSPVSDGYMIPQDVLAAYKNGHFNDVAMMAGWVLGDGSLMGERKMTPEKYKQQAHDQYGESADEFLRLFPGNTDNEVGASLNHLNLMQFAALPAYLWTGFNNNNKSFIYQFSHVPVDKPGFPNYGAFHTSEVPFALHTLHLWNRPWRDVDFMVEKIMNGYWVNFVRTGNPNGDDLPEWSNYEKSSGYIMEIGDKVKESAGLYKDEFEFLERTITKFSE